VLTGDCVLEVRSTPTPNGPVTTLIDITAQRDAEADLRRAKRAAEEANRAKSRFLAAMSHELRTPLNAIIGFSDSLLRDSGGDARVAEYAEAINGSGRQLLALINDILDVARIDAGRVDITAEALDVPRLLRSCVRNIDAAAQAAEVAIELDAPGDLPPLQGDERRLRQVFGQLLANAVKFTGAGGRVMITAAVSSGDAVLITVADTGIGIAESDLAAVFEPFSQVDGGFSRRFPGSGLGLYVARALVRAHDGQLTLQSRRGVGTTARVLLPGARPHPTHSDIQF